MPIVVHDQWIVAVFSVTTNTFSQFNGPTHYTADPYAGSIVFPQNDPNTMIISSLGNLLHYSTVGSLLGTYSGISFIGGQFKGMSVDPSQGLLFGAAVDSSSKNWLYAYNLTTQTLLGQQQITSSGVGSGSISFPIATT